MDNNIMKKNIYLFILCLSCISLHGQDMTLYNLHYAPQNLQVNPGFMPQSNWYVALPGLNIPAISIGNTFSMSDIFETNGESTVLNLNRAAAALNGGSGDLSIGLQTDILNFGLKFAEKHFIHLNVQNIMSIKFGYNTGLMNLIRYGFADSSNIGNTVTIADFGPQILNYSKIGIGYTLQLDDKITMGIRPNYYLGHAYLNSQNTNISFFTSKALDQLLIQADVEIQSGGIGNVVDQLVLGIDGSNNEENTDFMSQAELFSNGGFGLDFGIDMAFDKTLNLSASVVDLGYIRWNQGSMTHSVEDIEINFQGLNDLSILTGNSSNENEDSSLSFFDSLTNEISNQLVINTDKSPFITWMPTKVYLAGEWHLNSIVHLGFLIKSQFLNGGLQQTITVAPSFKLGRSLNTTISYTADNGSFDNIGFGIAWNAGPVQFYLVSDNLYGLTRYDYMRQTNFRFGINIRPKEPNNKRRRRR